MARRPGVCPPRSRLRHRAGDEPRARAPRGLEREGIHVAGRVRWRLAHRGNAGPCRAPGRIGSQRLRARDPPRASGHRPVRAPLHPGAGALELRRGHAPASPSGSDRGLLAPLAPVRGPRERRGVRDPALGARREPIQRPGAHGPRSLSGGRRPLGDARRDAERVRAGSFGRPARAARPEGSSVGRRQRVAGAATDRAFRRAAARRPRGLLRRPKSLRLPAPPRGPGRPRALWRARAVLGVAGWMARGSEEGRVRGPRTHRRGSVLSRSPQRLAGTRGVGRNALPVDLPHHARRRTGDRRRCPRVLRLRGVLRPLQPSASRRLVVRGFIRVRRPEGLRPPRHAAAVPRPLGAGPDRAGA